MGKSLCKKDKNKWKKNPKFRCEKCEREAGKKKHLCKPAKLEIINDYRRGSAESR